MAQALTIVSFLIGVSLSRKLPFFYIFIFSFIFNNCILYIRMSFPESSNPQMLDPKGGTCIISANRLFRMDGWPRHLRKNTLGF